MDINDLLANSDILLAVSKFLHPADINILSKVNRNMKKTIMNNKKYIANYCHNERKGSRYIETKFNNYFMSYNDKPSCIYSMYPLNQTIINFDWIDEKQIIELILNIKLPNIFTVKFHFGGILRREIGPASITLAGREIVLTYSKDGINEQRKVYMIQ